MISSYCVKLKIQYKKFSSKYSGKRLNESKYCILSSYFTRYLGYFKENLGINIFMLLCYGVTPEMERLNKTVLLEVPI